MVPGNLVILESTSPVGTTEKVAAEIAALRPDLKVPGTCTGAADIFIAHCPERVLPGRILVELVDNDRCIGGITPRCARRAMTFRSEEHTSELQSLMRISYAVFC